MEYRTLGTTDLSLSVIGLGGNNFGPPRIQEREASVRVIHQAVDLGVNFIDTDPGYGRGESERYVAAALRGRRDDALVATKFSLKKDDPRSWRQQIVDQCEESLARLETDHIDLYQMHWPILGLPPEAVLEPLTELVEQGKVRYAGQCNFAAWRHAVHNAAADHRGLARLASAQHNYNILNRQVELDVLPFCGENGVGFLPYYPLGGGYLTGKYRPYEPAPPGSRGDRNHREVGRLRNDRNEALLTPLTKFAEERGHTLLELAFAWLLAHPQTSSVIAGAMTPEQVSANVGAATWTLTPGELADVDAIAAWDTSIRGPEREGMP